jgi:hypothetical protein
LKRLEALVCTRWWEAYQALGPLLAQVRITWEVGDHYPHFQKPRGYGVTFHHDAEPYRCHLLFASKNLSAPTPRVDGVLRHEIGHVVDMTVPKAKVDAWAAQRGYRLPHTDERRADAIAEAIWGEPIRYDADLVQSTHYGVAPRPEHLGL